MEWIKEITKKMYGGYCNMCEELGIKPVQYDTLKQNPKEYNNVKETYYTFKRK